MKTIITKSTPGMRDGKNIMIEVIVGFGDAIIDPVSTEKKILPFLQDSDEVKQINALGKQIGEYQRLYSLRQREAMRLKEQRQQGLAKLKEDEARNIYAKIGPVQKQLAALKEPLQKKRNELVQQYAIYFEPRNQNEKIITAEQYHELISTELLPDQILCSDGSVIFDYSGKNIWQKISDRWERLELSPGEVMPGDAVLYSDLSDEQRKEIAEQQENDRVAALTTEEKEAEKLILIENAANQAQQMRSKLEIQGIANALEQSQAWYSEQVKEIEKKYS